MQKKTLMLTVLGLSFFHPARAADPGAPLPLTRPVPERRKSQYDDAILQAMDHGPFYFGSVHGKTVALKGVAIKLAKGQAGVCFDTELMRMADGWTGGYLQIKGERTTGGHPQIDGKDSFFTLTGPGWARNGSFDDPRSSPPEDAKGPKCGPLPRDWAHWNGLYRHGDEVVLSYSVGGTAVLEASNFQNTNGLGFFTRTFNLGPSSVPMQLLVCENNKAVGAMESGLATLSVLQSERPGTNGVAVALAGGAGGNELQIGEKGRIVLKIPAHAKELQLCLLIFSGARDDFSKLGAMAKTTLPAIDLAALCKGGPLLWGEPLKTAGKLGLGSGAYVVDTITAPEVNPYKSWIRCSGLDFFSDGRAAVCSLSGDVWIVSGLDDKLERITWQRHATGLYQPLGLKIVKDVVYVTCRDSIVRLRDLNGDGEADFYENFNNDVTITDHYHEFCFDLQTDSKGNFYFTKGGNLGEARIPHHGTLLKLPPDGSRLEIVCAGFREPNGMSVGPHDEITVSDNEGNWVPSSRVNLIKPGGLYGHVWNYHAPTPPGNFDPPLFWLPHSYEVDNSSGGQVWVTGGKWGPFEGDLLHTSYGACLLFHVMTETVNGVSQAAAFKMPLSFDSGIMRGRFSPRDGQLYVCGLNVWQSASRTGLNRRGIFERVRYTGKPAHQPREFHVKPNGIQITFTEPLDAASAGDPQNYSVEQWGYRWTKEYGSPEFKVSNPAEKGHDPLEVKSVKLSADKKTVTLELADLKPVMQMRVKYNINGADGAKLAQEIFNTINQVPVR